jgi:hypothetical protein
VNGPLGKEARTVSRRSPCGIVDRGAEGAGGGTGGAGKRLPVVIEVGVVDARLERAAGDALQAGAAEPVDEVALAHAGARLLIGDARVDLTRSAPEVREHPNLVVGWVSQVALFGLRASQLESRPVMRRRYWIATPYHDAGARAEGASLSRFAWSAVARSL